MNKLTYTRCGDYYIPDRYRRNTYNKQSTSRHDNYDRAARERIDAMLPRMMEAAGVTEKLKARDPMCWVGLMNTMKAQAEEVVLTELIYQ